MFIVSKCLLGIESKYNGGDNLTPNVVKFLEGHLFTAVCPETVYLPVPREASEIVKGSDGSFRVIDKLGRDVTSEFIDGSRETLIEVEKAALEMDQPIEAAILKYRSPSCGHDVVYDGSFSSVLVPGNGLFAQLLLNEFDNYLNGRPCAVEGVRFDKDFRILSEKDFEE